MHEYSKVQVTKLGGNGYGVILWENEKSRVLSDVIEPLRIDGSVHFIRRNVLEGGAESFRDFIGITKGADIDKILYEKAKEIALEKSRLYKISFVDSTER